MSCLVVKTSYAVAPNFCSRDRWSKKVAASIFMVVWHGYGGSRFLQNYLHNSHHNIHKSRLHTIKYSSTQNCGHAMAQLVEALASSWKVAVSISNVVYESFH
jgi:2-hydroxy-3-keto-5-methylthiopentenyl-1-phosphate phosphatase